jgi:hypothetical protein
MLHACVHASPQPRPARFLGAGASRSEPLLSVPSGLSDLPTRHDFRRTHLARGAALQRATDPAPFARASDDRGKGRKYGAEPRLQGTRSVLCVSHADLWRIRSVIEFFCAAVSFEAVKVDHVPLTSPRDQRREFEFARPATG